jgi:hypothetical protein
LEKTLSTARLSQFFDGDFAFVGEWNHIFQDKGIAAIDRLVHDAKIIQINMGSYRKKSLTERNPPQKPTKKRRGASQ